MVDILCVYCGSENVYFSKKKKCYICEDCEERFTIEKPFQPQKVFLSYGHDENVEIVREIYQRLQERGHYPWIDRAKIKSGMDWRNAISEGIRESTDFLAFCSDYSVRVPGVCLDEISIGVGNWNCRIHSILLEKDITIPNSISHIQWIDLSEWKSVKENSSEILWNKWLDEKMNQIFAVIEDEHSSLVAGNISELEKILSPITAALKMRLILRNEIVGRKWLISLISSWFQNPHAKKVMLLYGTPGIGKSVISAYICNFSDKCSASYFCEWNNTNSLNNKTFLHSILFQLACSMEDYQFQLIRAMKEVDIRSLSEDEIIDRFVYQLLNGLIDGGREKRLIVIDALDEAIGETKDFLRVVRKMIRKTPDWIRFLITGRPELALQEAFRSYPSISIDSHIEEIQEDLKEYVSRSVTDMTVSGKILDKSKGSFVYARELIQLYRSNEKNIDFSRIPPGLSGVYYSNFERLYRNDEEYRKLYRPIFEILLSAKEQISREELSTILGTSREDTFDRMKKLSSYILELRHNYHTYLQIFHKSFLEWLVSEEAGKYRVQRDTGNQSFINYIRHAVTEEKTLTLYVMIYAWDHLGNTWETIPEEEQRLIINRLVEAARVYGNLEKEYFYLQKIEETFGKKQFYYCNALEYYKKVSGERLSAVSDEALQLFAEILDDKERFDLICQVAFAYFYAGYASRSYQLITDTWNKYPEEFWADDENTAKYWHVVAVSAHDLDDNEDVIHAALLDIDAFRKQKKYYHQYISMVNLFDGYMAVGKLKDAEAYASRLQNYIENRYYIHVDDIFQLCYANLLQTEGRIMEALVYYEEGLKLAKDIQKWDYVYGSIWRELAIARFGDPSCLKAIGTYRKMAEELGYRYLESLANCYYIISAHILQRIDGNRIRASYERVAAIGMPGHILQSAICCSLDLGMEIPVTDILKQLEDCDGVKGHPALVEEYFQRNKNKMSGAQQQQFASWCERYWTPIREFQTDFMLSSEIDLDGSTKLASYSCLKCQAKCCYDGVYLFEKEEEKIHSFIKEFPEYFEMIPRPYIVDGDWEGMRSYRKTEKVPYAKYDDLFPAHFTKTRCVFAMPSGECMLQRVATDHQLHPWSVKPQACWSFPIRGIAGDTVLPPPTAEEGDPDYVDENYPGYTTFLPCVQIDEKDGKVWYRKYRNEVEYYQYLIRTGKL